MSDMSEPGFDQLAAQAVIDAPPAEPETWRAGAGRKGAKRIHQLIELGKAYERAHGLKPGRQRLRQLIELGKRHEADLGLARPARERKRRAKGSRQQVLAELVALLRVVCRSSYRAELDRLAEALAAKPEGLK